MSAKVIRKRIGHAETNLSQKHGDRKSDILRAKVKKYGIKKKFNAISTD